LTFEIFSFRLSSKLNTANLMPNESRIEYPGAAYHVINRGNYRADVFATDGAREAFIRTLDEACVRSGWTIHAWCLMSNHYHLALSTSQANLAAGMQWFQGTFSVRFNRFRKERGHIFQGRYKALNVEAGRALGSVCHYIHLNPIRAKMMDMAQLKKWPWCSLQWILQPRKRKPWFEAEAALRQSGELADTPAGHRAYVDYLAWLSADEEAQKNQCFERMSKGWAMGSHDFQKRLLAEMDDARLQWVAGARELAWEKMLVELKANFSASDMSQKTKSADWKVALAAEMKRQTTATNQWLSDALGMGNPFAVSRLAGECRAGKRAAASLEKLTAKGRP